MARVDLDQLSLDELKQLEKDVTKAIKNFEARRKSEALAAVEAKAREMGFTIAELTGDSKAKGKATVSAPKYQHPENPALTWTGRGRKPNWFQEAVDAGTPAESMLIK
ncbi:hypothetical protein P775_26845 [Puniceibacterium antarcticum]|uniref:DNA-binding protein H-NS-like C-terminal domain-containing protein n=1 Tax=Puniceibacterium antarcticum TaxID=1206336 RepID=A0A2G8QYF4_9RHOB|nr:H-NS histone family protein [Puniceibacterium antarcticum]PIL14326.1 hypothetical protein P775_26845 [Puniceibacterium antarcticum]